MSKTAKYPDGAKVWLAKWEDQPREKAVVLGHDVMPWGISYVCQVESPGVGDDGLRELTEDQIEGLQEV